MYNALTSIAMMCTEDPETAQEATVTFAKYLRGNSSNDYPAEERTAAGHGAGIRKMIKKAKASEMGVLWLF